MNQNTGTLADSEGVRAIDARTTRKYAFHFVLLGLAGALAAALWMIFVPMVAIVLGLVLVAICIGVFARFVTAHRSTAARQQPLTRAFWMAYAPGLLLVFVTAALRGADWPVLTGGALCLVAGLVVGHLVQHGMPGAASR